MIHSFKFLAATAASHRCRLLLAALCASLSLAACGGGGGDDEEFVPPANATAPQVASRS